MIPGSLANRRRQSEWLRIATGGALKRHSSAVKFRPSASLTPSTSRKLSDTPTSRSRSGSPEPVSVCRRPKSKKAKYPASVSKLVFSSRHALNVSARVVRADIPLVPSFSIHTRRPGSRNGRGRSSTASTMLNIAVHAPMPRASVSSATVANPGDLMSCRSANLRLAMMMSPIQSSARRLDRCGSRDAPAPPTPAGR